MAESGKITALKTASHKLLNQVQAATVNGDVYVSIIPFSKDVTSARRTTPPTGLTGRIGMPTTATTRRPRPARRPLIKAARAARNAPNSTTRVPNTHNTWNGCITREQYAWCPLQMMGLSYNLTAMNSLIDQIYPAGNTNQPIGLVWGWQSLVGDGPLTAPAKDPNYKYNEIIILLSEGLMQTPIDNRIVQTGNGSGTCANIKAAGITIYTIQVNTGGDPTSTLLQNCASDPSKFFMLTSANQIVTTFQAIATNLTQVQRDDLDPHGTGFPKSHDVRAGPISSSKTSCQGGTPSGYRQVSPPVNALATTSERRKRQRWTVRRPLMRAR